MTGWLAAAGLTVAAGWLLWFVQHAGGAPQLAADVRYEFADMVDLPADAEGHFVAAVADGRLAARRTPEPDAPLLGRVTVNADGMALGVALNTAEGVLCMTSQSGEEACAVAPAGSVALTTLTASLPTGSWSLLPMSW